MPLTFMHAAFLRPPPPVYRLPPFSWTDFMFGGKLAGPGPNRDVLDPSG